MKQTKESQVFAAAVLGNIAHREGRAPVPCQDKKLMELLADASSKEIGSCLPLLKAWSTGWHEANLAQ